MTTLAHIACAHCGADVMVAIAIEHQQGPGVNVLAPIGASIAEIACCHALENAEWLASPDGIVWQSEALENYMTTGGK